MRFIHLSDLHIGRQLHQYNLKKIRSISWGGGGVCKCMRPDAIVIAGECV